jgi:ABC-type Zn uptake system ZnuABC Zn-binding protein ZnuA
MRQQQIETLEAYLSETKDSLARLSDSSAAQLEQQLTKFNEERRELVAKTDRSAADLARKERQLTTLEN